MARRLHVEEHGSGIAMPGARLARRRQRRYGCSFAQGARMYRPALSVVLAVFAASVQAAPETYVIDAGHTSSEFSYRYLGIAEQTHRFERISGKVVFDAAAQTGSADVAIDATSVSTAHALFDKTIQSADFFDTARHPLITFTSTRMTLGGPQPSMTGELTIKGVTQPVTLAITQFQCAPD